MAPYESDCTVTARARSWLSHRRLKVGSGSGPQGSGLHLFIAAGTPSLAVSPGKGTGRTNLPAQKPRPESRTNPGTKGYHCSVPDGHKRQRIIGAVKRVGSCSQ